MQGESAPLLDRALLACKNFTAFLPMHPMEAGSILNQSNGVFFVFKETLRVQAVPVVLR
ncbi:hypothetical protein CCHOA_08280 [Corynebacterium choanae]|uniref:Uncharacterized protein n=1 Tax=Corynebacterium choanae TaxID=1862358 RepID=A0A3G6J7G5_9CORY|nr:hypothetical protein CCHOA_08280 [Corynebacterium choanae]